MADNNERRQQQQQQQQQQAAAAAAAADIRFWDMLRPSVPTLEEIERCSVEELLKPYSCGCTRLGHAVKHGASLEIVRAYCDKVGVQVAHTAADKHGNIALSHVKKTTAPAVASYVASNTPPAALENLIDADGDTALHCLFQGEAADAVLMTVMSKCPVAVFGMANQRGRLVLHEACAKGVSPTVMRSLLHYSPDSACTAPDKDMKFPIHSLSPQISVESVECMIRRVMASGAARATTTTTTTTNTDDAATVNATSITISTGTTSDVVDLLCGHRDRQGRTALHGAVAAGVSPAVVELLLRHSSCDVLCQADGGGGSGAGEIPLHTLLTSQFANNNRPRKDELLALLIRSAPPAAFATVDGAGRLPLHCIRVANNSNNGGAGGTNNDVALVHALLERSPPRALLQADHRGRLPLHACLESSSSASSAGGGSALLDICKVFMGENQQREEEEDPKSNEVLWTENAEGQLPIHTAALHHAGNADLVRLLLEHVRGDDDDHHHVTLRADKNGRLPLHCALERCRRGGRGGLSAAVLRLLLGPKPAAVLSAADHQGRRPLHAALLHRATLPVVKTLLSEHRNNTWGPSLAANDESNDNNDGIANDNDNDGSSNDNDNTNDVTIDNHDGVVVDDILATADGRGRVPLACAVEMSLSLEIVRLCISRGALEALMRPDDQGRLLLHTAVQASTHSEVVALLARRLPQLITQADHEGKLALHCALKRAASLPVMRVLVGAGAGDNDNDSDNSPLPLLRVADGQGRLAVHLLSRARLDVGRMILSRSGPQAMLTPDAFGQLPLHRVILERAPKDMIKHVVDASPSPQAFLHADRDGRIPLYHALASVGSCCFPPSSTSAEMTTTAANNSAAGTTNTNNNGTTAGTAIIRPLRRGLVQRANNAFATAAGRASSTSSSSHYNHSRQRKQVELVELLIQKCPITLETEASDRDDGRLPLHDAVELGVPLSIIETMLKRYPAAAKRADRVTGKLPLHYALQDPDVPLELIEGLLQVFPGAVHRRDANGRLPLYEACHSQVSLNVIFTLARLSPDHLLLL